MALPKKNDENPVPRKFRVSFTIRDEIETQNRKGVNSLAYDKHLNHLYSAGRDGIIRRWECLPGTDVYVQSFEGHTDWVSDVVLCYNGNYLFSASMDKSVKIWDTNKGHCMYTSIAHQDYVRALAYSPARHLVASGGFDQCIYLWDLSLQGVTRMNLTPSLFGKGQNSIYSLGMSHTGSLIASGGLEKTIRLWDPRSKSQCGELVGHKDNVKSLLVDTYGYQCLSAGTDGMIKKWCVRQRAALCTISKHNSGVWTLWSDEHFSILISSGNDQRVLITDLRNPNNYICLCEEEAPVLKVLAVPDMSGVWVSTHESDITYWEIPKTDVHRRKKGWSIFSLVNRRQVETPEGIVSPPFVEEPTKTIEGATAIERFHILSDKRHILVEDTDSNGAIYDVLQARKVEDLGEIDFDEEVKKRAGSLFVPNWFTVDITTGFLTIHLTQESCLAAWSTHLHPPLVAEGPTNVKEPVNYGWVMLKALFWNWKKLQHAEYERGPQRYPQPRLQLPGHIIVYISDPAKYTYLVMNLRNAGRALETDVLRSVAPTWVEDLLINNITPSPSKLSFICVPLKPSGEEVLHCIKFFSLDTMLIYTVNRHLLMKVMSNEFGRREDIIGYLNPAVTPRLQLRVRLFCRDQLLNWNIDVRTVKNTIWRSSDEMVIHFRVVPIQITKKRSQELVRL